jgi:hypothetical protein
MNATTVMGAAFRNAMPATTTIVSPFAVMASLGTTRFATMVSRIPIP